MTAKEFDRALAIVALLEITPSKNDKLSILEQSKDCQALKDIFYYTYNPFLVYHIDEKKLDKYSAAINFGEDADYEFAPAYDRFINTLNQMALKKSCSDIDANVLRHRLKYLNECLNAEDYKGNRHYIERMILKDLKVVVNVVTINKIWPKLIPEFNVQLASPMEKDITTECFVEPKYDGARCIAILDHALDSVKLFTRNGKQINDFSDIERNLRLIMYTLPKGSSVVFDGEILSENFDSTMEGLFSKKKDKKAVFYVFDVVNYSDFLGKTKSAPLRARKSDMLKIFSDLGVEGGAMDLYGEQMDYVKEVSYKIVKPPVSMARIEEEALWFTNDGFEGAMAKEANSQYNPDCKQGYRKGWHKYKFMKTIDVEVQGWEYGTGRLSDTVGAIKVGLIFDKGNNEVYGVGMHAAVEGGDYEFITVGVGSGFSDEQRERFKNGDNCKIVEIKYQEHTKDGSLRFPVFVRERPDLL